jgi:hypothetical protein
MTVTLKNELLESKFYIAPSYVVISQQEKKNFMGRIKYPVSARALERRLREYGSSGRPDPGWRLRPSCGTSGGGLEDFEAIAPFAIIFIISFLGLMTFPLGRIVCFMLLFLGVPIAWIYKGFKKHKEELAYQSLKPYRENRREAYVNELNVSKFRNRKEERLYSADDDL